MDTAPLIIAEIGINHEGDIFKARRMIRDAAAAGCRCVKFQCHCVDDLYGEYVLAAREIIPANATENIYDMMKRCSFDEAQERELKKYTESFNMQYLCTPFSRAAADRLERLGVTMYKIGSGELNNYPLVKYIVSKGKPIILSTGMNGWLEIDKAVDIIGDQLFAILHCVSEYPTPYEHVNLNRMLEIKERYGKPTGLSDHSQGIYTALAAVALGASVVEKHFTSDKNWEGADIAFSLEPRDLRELVIGADAIGKAINNDPKLRNLSTEKDTARFAFASVVSLRDIHAGDPFTPDNLWVKRPGTGIKAASYESILGKIAARDIAKDSLLNWDDITCLKL